MAKKPKATKGFLAKVRRLPRDHCQCFDCLREIGLTPPLGLRDRHQRISPSEICTGPGIDFPGTHIVGEQAKEVQRARRQREERERQKSMAPEPDDDKRHIREAIRNREVI